MATFPILKTATRAGRRRLDELSRRGRSILDRKLLDAAEGIVSAVRAGGDRALRRLVKKHDGVGVRSLAELRFDPAEQRPPKGLPAGFDLAFERAISAVEAYHKRQVHPGFEAEEGGVQLVERRVPLRRVGIYVPGGRAAYPSTVAMTVLPARVAGVEEIVVVTPPATLERSAALHHALRRLGVREVWALGGAHAVAALAYGTESIAPVDKIVGPGNAWVTAAKYLVSADVAIDGLAGPSEVVIVALDAADPERLAADLLAQAEHDPEALPLMLTTDPALARSVRRQLKQQLADLPTAAVAKASLARRGGALVVEDAEEALAVVERLAPEHLQLVGEGAEALAPRIRSAGATFLGDNTPEVFGDYVAGPSHVLPTGGSARFASGLGVDDFVRRSHQVRFSRFAASRLAEAAGVLAEAEGLPAHARSARLRGRRGQDQGR